MTKTVEKLLLDLFRELPQSRPTCAPRQPETIHLPQPSWSDLMVEGARLHWSQPPRMAAPPPSSGLVHARMLEAAQPSACEKLSDKPKPDAVDSHASYNEEDLADLLCEQV